MEWARACTNPVWFISLGHFTRSADCYEGLHLNKACLIPHPSVTSREPDSKFGDGTDDDDASESESTLKNPLSPLSFRHLPGADDVLSATGFRSARVTSQGGEATQGASLKQMKYSLLSLVLCAVSKHQIHSDWTLIPQASCFQQDHHTTVAQTHSETSLMAPWCSVLLPHSP